MLVLTSLTLITVDSRSPFKTLISGTKSTSMNAFAPIHSGVASVLSPIGDFVIGAVDYGAAERENKSLRRQLEAMRDLPESSLRSRVKFNALSTEFGVVDVANLPVVSTESTSSGSSNFAATISIGAGRSDGIRLNMPVISGGCLIGTIVQTSDSQSVVRLITDGQSSVGVSVAQDGANIGVLSGSGPGEPLEISLSKSVRPEVVDQTLITDGLEHGSIPFGLPVARLELHSRTTRPSSQLYAVPLVNLNEIRYVSVILYIPPVAP